MKVVRQLIHTTKKKSWVTLYSRCWVFVAGESRQQQAGQPAWLLHNPIYIKLSVHGQA
jgi:hypothetical protein